jgi:hypothetical protein
MHLYSRRTCAFSCAAALTASAWLREASRWLSLTMASSEATFTSSCSCVLTEVQDATAFFAVAFSGSATTPPVRTPVTLQSFPSGEISILT